MSYREKPHFEESKPLSQKPLGERLLLVFAILPMTVIGVTRSLAAHGYVATSQGLLWGTVALGALCAIGGLIAYRHTKKQVARDLSEFDHNG